MERLKKGDTFRVEIQTKFAPIHDDSRYIIPNGVSFVDYGDGFEDISAGNEFASIKVYAVSNIIITNNSVKYYTDESPFTVLVEPNEVVTFEINGIKATVKSDENGIAGIGLNLKPGNYTIEVGYNGTKIIFPITIKNTIVSQDVSRGINSNYNYKVQLLNSTGEAIKNINVTVTVNGKSKTFTTDNSGYISIPFTKLTSNQVVTVLNPITKEQSKNTIRVVSRFFGNKNIRLYYNNGTKYTLKVYGDDAKLVGGNQIVVIKLNKKTYEVKTNNKGVASLRIPKSLKPGTYTITATYKGQTIKNTVATFEGTCKNKHISFNLVLLGEQLLVSADKGRIEQVLYNLIDNAIKFSKPDSVIKLETSEKNETIFVSVKDTGIGIPKESLKLIFDRFYKTDISRGKDKKGTGLGLSIVKEIINAHHENINVISTVDVGTEFIFTLPKSKKSDDDD